MSDLAMGTHLTHHGPWRPRPVGPSGSRWANKALLLHVARSHAPRAAVGTLRPLHPVEPVMLRRQGSLLWSAWTATLLKLNLSPRGYCLLLLRDLMLLLLLQLLVHHL